MSARFKDVYRDRPMLLSPDMRDWIPADDMVHFVLETVEQISMEQFQVNHRGTGSKQYPPRMMLALLIFCYANGVFSSRRIEQATYRDIAVRYITANTHPDHQTICRFRRRNFEAVSAAFLEVLKMARELKLLKVGTVSVDGTHIKANASIRKSIRYDRACELDQVLAEDIAELMHKAEESDVSSADDGQRIPKEIKRREQLRDKIRRAKKDLEERALNRAQAEQAEYERKCEKREKRSGKRKGRKVKPPKEGSKDSEQSNMTDKDSRIMRKSMTSPYLQAYNAQAAVDADGTQLILHAHVTNCATDRNELLPAVNGVIKNVGFPKVVLADTGYVNVEACKDVEKMGVEPYVPPSRLDTGQRRKYDFRPSGEGSFKAVADEYLVSMREKLTTNEGRALYSLRKHTVEPVFGIIKSVLGFQHFFSRGLSNVAAEWELVCLSYNVKRLFALVAG